MNTTPSYFSKLFHGLFFVMLTVGMVGNAEEPKKEKPSKEKKETSKIEKEKDMSNTPEVAVIKTDLGEMVVSFWPDVAPKTVENFKKLAKEGFYDGTAFHRVVKGFMIQGGDPLSKKDDPAVGTGGPGYQIKAEFNDKPHVKGVLSMARSANPDSAGSQFFICLADASFLNGKYTAFGKLIKGEDVLEKIGEVPTAVSGGGEKSKPTKRMGVTSIKIVPEDSQK
jgi:peptidyl-prolyl cis-trans isomerase B (cyclophilin B)